MITCNYPKKILNFSRKVAFVSDPYQEPSSQTTRIFNESKKSPEKNKTSANLENYHKTHQTVIGIKKLPQEMVN